jgi:hypothetical protein
MSPLRVFLSLCLIINDFFFGIFQIISSLRYLKFGGSNLAQLVQQDDMSEYSNPQKVSGGSLSLLDGSQEEVSSLSLSLSYFFFLYIFMSWAFPFSLAYLITWPHTVNYTNQTITLVQ